MTNEVLVSWSRLTLDNAWRDPSKVRLDAYPELAGYNQGFFPNQSPYLPLNIITSGWGQGGPGNLWAPAMDVFAHNDALQFSDKLTKIAGSHGLKFGFSAERGQKQQNFENDEFGEYQFDPWATGGTGGPVSDLLTGRLANYSQGTAIPKGEWRYWNIDAFAQDSWKVKPNLTLEFGVRAGFWTNNGELNDFGGYFDPDAYNRERGHLPRPGHVAEAQRLAVRVAGTGPAGRHRQPQPVCDAARQRRVGHRRPGQQRPAWRLRHVLQPEHGQPRVPTPAECRRCPTALASARAMGRTSVAVSG